MKISFSFPKLLFALLVLSLSGMIYTSSFFNVLYDTDFFQEFYEEQNTDSKVEYPAQKSTEVVAFLNSEINEIQDKNPVFADHSFADEEVDHLKEVRGVVSSIRSAYYVSFLLFIILTAGFVISLAISKDKDAGRKLRIFFMKLQVYVIGICASILLVLWLILTFGFGWAFRLFHEIFFTPGTWIFPEGTLSIILFPEGFYVEFVSQVLFNVLMFVVMLSVLFIFVYMIYKPRGSKRKAHD